jgi:hypothetical protein
VRTERDWLIALLSGASAIGDPARHCTDAPERARIAVGKAIRRAITRITEADVVIGETLRSRVRTGILAVLASATTASPVMTAPKVR